MAFIYDTSLATVRLILSGLFDQEPDLKLIVPHEHDQKTAWNDYVSKRALFNVVNDPHETRDVASEPAYRAEVTRLHKLLDAWWTPGNDRQVAKPR